MLVHIPDPVAYDDGQDRHSLCFYEVNICVGGVGEDSGGETINIYTNGQNNDRFWGAWVTQLVKHLTSAQVMITLFVSSSPTSGSVWTAQSLDPAADSVSPSLSLPLPRSCSLSLSQK